MPVSRPDSSLSDARLSRRRFLVATAGLATAGAGALLAGCSTASSSGPTSSTQALGAGRLTAGSPAVAAAERARQWPGQRTVDVALDAVVGPVDIGGTTVSTWTYGGMLPGKEIRVRAGDLLHARVNNHLPRPTSVHWHGIALRNDMDGVPALTQAEIASGATSDYRFTVPDPGTYMFHPHVGPQLDRGLYGALIVDDPAEPGRYDDELVVLLDDWLDGTGRDPDQVLAGLQANGMGDMGGGGMARSALLGGDAGDVTYPYFLANGRTGAAPTTHRAAPGRRIRLRLINIGGDTVFRVGLPGTRMTITHTDGFPVLPTSADAVLIGMGERVDAVVTMPDAAVPLLAIAEGKNGSAHVLLAPPSTGPAAPDIDAATAAVLARPVLMVTALAPAADVRLPERQPDVVHDLILAGPGQGYAWTINGESYHPDRGLPVYAGQRVRLRMTNSTTMFHPMHLHGHTFQVRGPAGPGPRKDTVNVLPGRTVEVDFDADNPGQWLTHCHNVYHGEAGMMTVLSYLA